MFRDLQSIVLMAIIFILIISQIVAYIKISRLNKKVKKNNITYKAEKIDISKLSDRADEDISILIEQNYKQDKAIENSFSRIAVEHFDAFGNTGGKLSFSIAMLNNLSDGFILTSIHNEDGSHVYLKEIKSGNAYNELSKEERVALNKALDIIVIGDLEIK